MRALAVQPDLFGGPAQIPGFHRVNAHMRVVPDGTEVFVAEHLRMNRPNHSRRSPATLAATSNADGDQMPLFGAPPR